MADRERDPRDLHPDRHGHRDHVRLAAVRRPRDRAIGEDQEQAARTLGASGWQTFWRITLPAIRWGLTYGVVLATARALGEFGAVSIVSGRISGETETLPLFVQKQFEVFNVSGAYAAALVLAIIALVTLGAMNLVRKRDVSSVSPFNIAGDRDKAEEAV
jgi:ABC-type sulfate transport system permease subunit